MESNLIEKQLERNDALHSVRGTLSQRTTSRLLQRTPYTRRLCRVCTTARARFRASARELRNNQLKN